jgi:Lectin C-type domain
VQSFSAAVALGLAALVCGCSYDAGGIDWDTYDAAVIDVPGLDQGHDLPPDSGTIDVAAPPDARVDAGVPSNCPIGYVKGTGVNASHCYRLVTIGQKWQNAEQDCENDLPGASHLIVIDNEDEYQALQSNLNGTLWAGASDRVTEGTFLNVTGTAFEPEHWFPGQPDDFNDGPGGMPEDCVLVDVTNNGIEDVNCNNTHGYVCEIDGIAPAPGAF